MKSGQAKPGNFAIVPGQDDAGKPIFSVIVKRTYAIDPGARAVRAEQDRPLSKVDEYYDGGGPEQHTVRFEYDLAPFKPLADVVVVGKAHAPHGRPVSQLDVSVGIGECVKTIRVIGNRRCVFRENGLPGFTDPAEFAEMEIRYEKAYGGRDVLSDPEKPFAYPRNPMGVGIAIKNIPEVVDGLALPNLEDPLDLLTPERIILEYPVEWNSRPLPQGFGWFQRTWYPRCSFAGSMPGNIKPDEPMREEALGIVPKGQIGLSRRFGLPAFDVRFNNGGSYGMIMPVSGDESVRLVNLTPGGALDFFLPNDPPRITLDIGAGENELRPAVHTVCILPEDGTLDMVWRGSLEYPGTDWLPQMKRLVASVR